jgi:phenylacetate-coenzyme A ligase PaaK-like adenylate-forming protein
MLGPGQAPREYVALYEPTVRAIGQDYEDFIVQCLWQELPLAGSTKRITALHVSPAFLFERLTDELCHRGIDLRESGVRHVILSGGHVTKRMRVLAREAWNARTTVSYSCTEVRGGAYECPRHEGVYHLVRTTYAEVADTQGRHCVAGDCGRLLLTSLYPFQSSMPLLRYDVGDVVQLLPRTCDCGMASMSFRLLGRTTHCIDWSPVSGRPEYLGSLDLAQGLSTVPQLPTTPYPTFEWSLARTNDRWALTVCVEMYNPLGHERNVIESQIATAILDALPLLAGAAAQGRVCLVVRLYERGELRDPIRIGSKG